MTKFLETFMSVFRFYSYLPSCKKKKPNNNNNKKQPKKTNEQLSRKKLSLKDSKTDNDDFTGSYIYQGPKNAYHLRKCLDYQVKRHIMYKVLPFRPQIGAKMAQ